MYDSVSLYTSFIFADIGMPSNILDQEIGEQGMVVEYTIWSRFIQALSLFLRLSEESTFLYVTYNSR